MSDSRDVRAAGHLDRPGAGAPGRLGQAGQAGQAGHRTTSSRPGDPGGQDEGEGEGSFRRTFLTTQVVFLLFALIAAIPEAPSGGSVDATIQLAIVGCLWVFTTAVTLAVRAARVRTMRTRH
jgi:hypothetical protein